MNFKMKFTEASLEQSFTELLAREGYVHTPGEKVEKAPDEVLIEEDLKAFLLAQYKEEGLTATEAESIILQLKRLPASDLYDSNRTFMRLLSEGFILKREDRSCKDIYIHLIDYSGLDKQRNPDDISCITFAAEEKAGYGPDNNIYRFVNQLEIFGNEKRIPDGIIYINGLPLVVFEFKSAVRENATIHSAYTQLTVRYRRDIPELFKYNVFCVISDGVNNKAGSFFAPYEHYYAWRRVAGLAKDVDGIEGMYTLIQGMFFRNRMKDIIRSFVYLPDSSKKNETFITNANH